MDADDGEANYAYYCLHKFHWKPSEFVSLPQREKAFIIASINERIKNEKKQAKSIKRKR